MFGVSQKLFKWLKRYREKWNFYLSLWSI